MSSQLAYWQATSADVDGVLGGYPQVSRADVQFSRNFLNKLRRTYGRTESTRNPTTDKEYPFAHALEAGAGIGRVTCNLLVSMCAKIDVIEPIKQFTDVFTGPESPLVQNGQLCRIWNLPLQEWTADSKPDLEFQSLGGGVEYDLIYNQWCLHLLPLPALVTYLRQLIPLLTPHGWIIVKENISTDAFHEDIFDPDESSVTRSDVNWRKAFREAKLQIVKTELQTGFPKSLGLFPVRMYALRPE
jgi:protein N-terminal methyltransferase